MRPRHPPRLWLMTDPRMGDALWPAVARLPRGSGVVFRHYGVAGRRALFARVRGVAKARRLVLVLAGSARQAAAWRADGVHGDARRVVRPLLRTRAVHDAREAVAARCANVAFVSPVFATRSHDGARTLGRVGFVRLARGVPCAVALGGMDASNVRGLHDAWGWAGIDAWAAPDQKRKAVPT